MPLALLLFLICAALSAVVLTAGTAAAGRYASLSDADQRYYSVTSAAQLIRDELDEGDKSVNIVCEKTFKHTTSYRVDDAGRTTRIGPVESEPSYNLEIEGQSPSATSSVLGLAARALVAGTDSTSWGATAWNWAKGSRAVAPSDNVTTFNLEFQALDDGSRRSTVSVTEAVESDGTLVFTLTSEPADDGATYALELACTPQVEVSQTPREVTSSNVVKGASEQNRTEEMTYQETKTLTVTWTDFEIRKAGA